MGDVNVKFLASGDGKDFKSIISSNRGLKQIIRKATRIFATKTLIDIIATNSTATIVYHDVNVKSIYPGK